MSLVSDIAASEAADIAEAIRQLRNALVELLEEAEANRVHGPPHHTIASKRAHQLIADLDAGELLWPGWKKGQA